MLHRVELVMEIVVVEMFHVFIDIIDWSNKWFNGLERHDKVMVWLMVGGRRK